MSTETATELPATHHTAETRFVGAGGVRFAFRRFGAPAAAPLRSSSGEFPTTAHYSA